MVMLPEPMFGKTRLFWRGPIRSSAPSFAQICAPSAHFGAHFCTTLIPDFGPLPGHLPNRPPMKHAGVDPPALPKARVYACQLCGASARATLRTRARMPWLQNICVRVPSLPPNLWGRPLLPSPGSAF